MELPTVKTACDANQLRHRWPGFRRGFAAALAAIVLAACGPGGEPPLVESLADQTVGVGEELVLRIHASDADGDVLRYSYDSEVPDIRGRATLTLLPIGAAEFRWTPTADDVNEWYFDFHVSDGDFTTTRTVAIDVRSAVGLNSAPRFLRPTSNGKSFDLSSCNPEKAGGCCVELEIEIEDADTVDVAISEEEPKIPGAELEQTSSTTALWSWCPSSEQLGVSNRYSLNLSAADGDNPATLLHYLVILRREGKTDCPGEAPVVADKTNDQNTLGHVQITAEISDDQGLKEAPIVFYSEDEPAEVPNLAAMDIAVMTKTGLTRWTAEVPNPVAADPAGSSTELYYYILVSDDDDASGDCDHEVLLPASGSAASITVGNPGGKGQLAACDSCVADVQCGSTASDLCVRVGNRGGSSCLQYCMFDVDCPTGYQCSEDLLESVDGAFERQCVPVNESCEAECIDDDYEDNDSRLQADERDALEIGTINATSCPMSAGADDEDWWRIELDGDADVELVLATESTSDLDLYVYDADGNPVTGSNGTDDLEAAAACLHAGTYYVRVMSPNTVAQNDYSLDYLATSTTCEEPLACEDPGPEPNDTFGDATTIFLDDQGSYEATDAVLCQGDEDWYVVNAFTDETITALIDFVHAEGDLDLALLGSDGTTVLDSSLSSTDGEIVQFQNTNPSCGPDDPPCLFYLAVVGYNDAQNQYTLSVEVGP